MAHVILNMVKVSDIEVSIGASNSSQPKINHKKATIKEGWVLRLVVSYSRDCIQTMNQAKLFQLSTKIKIRMY